MHTILLICPYFGKFPKYQFPLWLQSCSYNATIDWLIITDDNTSYDYPPNVKVQYTEWETFKQRVQSNFDFPISLERPFKICDFRPAFGEIFQEELEGYDFWGHTDISDTIYGDLRKYLTEEKLTNAEKVMLLGHFSLFRNTNEVNQRYKLPTKSGMTYKDVFTTEKSMVFDECVPHSINRFFVEYEYPITDIRDFCFDITEQTPNFTQHVIADDWSHFYDPTGHVYCVQWKKGKVYAYRRQGWILEKKEVGYAHFKRRQMTGQVKKDSSFLIVPNRFVPAPLLFTVFHFLFYSSYCPIYKPLLYQKLVSGIGYIKQLLHLK